jgi:hypothetical protein
MRNRRWLVLPILLLFVMACLCTGIQNITNAVSTQLPDVLTGVPTAQGMIETLAAQASTSSCTGTPTAGGLGVELDRAKTVLQTTGQFTFTDSTTNGQPVSIATLASSGASTFSAIASGFSAQFFGDPCNLTKILVLAPYTSDQATVDQGLAAANILFAAIIPVDVQLPFVTWLATEYPTLSVGDQKQTTIKNMQFTLSRTQAVMSLEIVPAP